MIFVLTLRDVEAYSHDILEVLAVSTNEKQLNSIARRLNQFKDVFSVKEVIFPLFAEERGFVNVAIHNDSDLNYALVETIFDDTELKMFEHGKKLKMLEDNSGFQIKVFGSDEPKVFKFHSMKIYDSIPNSIVKKIAKRELNIDDFQQVFSIKRKINIGKKNGQYYQNKERFEKLENLL
tara:strand:+ start:4303 stop:4839 length:537 start_codon:yes stop_codon:yes gene_type:complete